ncbi:hypothetical protein EW145_g2159 [Phellinidium pouzarii]|uniref:Uncharacterized protein n=1 Tax=Phellinidium pouzarii TaxID=167371 RepID=A0A4S4LDV0_9AGAM|nr:hypothetical protein EW145_g2159 [Phellinidium pouzarii]
MSQLIAEGRLQEEKGLRRCLSSSSLHNMTRHLIPGNNFNNVNVAFDVHSAIALIRLTRTRTTVNTSESRAAHAGCTSMGRGVVAIRDNASNNAYGGNGTQNQQTYNINGDTHSQDRPTAAIGINGIEAVSNALRPPLVIEAPGPELEGTLLVKSLEKETRKKKAGPKKCSRPRKTDKSKGKNRKDATDFVPPDVNIASCEIVFLGRDKARRKAVGPAPPIARPACAALAQNIQSTTPNVPSRPENGKDETSIFYLSLISKQPQRVRSVPVIMTKTLKMTTPVSQVSRDVGSSRPTRRTWQKIEALAATPSTKQGTSMSSQLLRQQTAAVTASDPSCTSAASGLSGTMPSQATTQKRALSYYH